MAFGEAPFGASGTDLVQRDAPTSAGCVLRVIKGPDVGGELELTYGRAIVGSRAPADLVIRDSAISGKHLEVEVLEHGLRVTDLGSTNGTYYLATRVRDVVVSAGVVLDIGNSQLLLAPHRSSGHTNAPALASYGHLIGASAAMQAVYARLQRLETSEASVLIIGETGSGKELIARAIHEKSARRDGPFEVLDCTALPQNLAESELFGHVRGAFTGAERNHTGAFERANGGTLFIDELGELPLELQPKLLRALENRQVRPVGGSAFTDVNVRLIAATNRNLERDVEHGRFRADLYYRVNVARVDLPPLRERRDDIPALVQLFLEEAGAAVTPSRETLESFVGVYDWPGNVRELRNAVASALALGELPRVLSERMGSSIPPPAAAANDLPFLEARKRFVDNFERDYLVNMLKRSDNNASKAARLAGMDRAYFRRLLLRHGLT